MYARATNLLLALIFLLAANASYAQVTVVGTVTDSETGEPLIGAHVFITETMIGTATDRDGLYNLTDALPGFHRIYASMMGYQSVSRDTLLQSGKRFEIDLELEPTVIDIGEIVVEEDRDRRWQRRFERFYKNFIGVSSHAEHVRLLNPEALRFSTTWWGRLDAEAVEPLIIENYFLGYRLIYHLDEFEDTGSRTRWDGEPYFTEMIPRDSTEAERWVRNREQTYLGSFRHFIISLWEDRLSEENFIARQIEERRGGMPHMRHREWPVVADRIWDDVDVSDFELSEDGEDLELREMRFRGRLAVTFTDQEASPEYMRWEGRRIGAHRSSQRSYIELNDRFVTIDELGEIKETYGLTRYGYFAFERIAALLPKEYRPTSGNRAVRP